MAIITTVPQQQSITQRFYTTKAKINTEVVVKSSGRWPGAGLSGSSEEAHGSRVRPRHALDSPSSLSRILMRPSTFHSLYAHTTLARSYDRGRSREGARRYRVGERPVRYWGRRRWGWWLYRISWRHDDDVTGVTSLTVPPTARPPPPRPPPPARACANGTASTERSFRTPPPPPPLPHSPPALCVSERARRSALLYSTVIPDFLSIFFFEIVGVGLSFHFHLDW